MDNVSYDPMSLNSNNKPSEEKTYTPTDEERKIVKKCNELLEAAKAYRCKYDENWSDYYKMFRGKQWKEKRPSYRHSEVINMIFQTIQSTVPILTDAKPKFEYIATEPSDYGFAEIINQVSEWDWVRNNWQMALTEVIYDSHIFGTGISQMYFDSRGDNGLGAIMYESTDTFYNFPDPNATDVNKRCHHYIYAEPMDLDVIKRLYPEKGKYVKADVQNMNNIDRSQPKDIRYKSPSENVIVTDYEQPQAYGQRKQALVVSLFIKDDEYEEEEQKTVDETGAESITYLQKMKYPKGRLIRIAGNVVLQDTENFMETGDFPFQRLVNYINPRQFWGISEIEQLESPQRIFNRLLSFALDVAVLMGNPIWVVDTNSGIDTDNLINRPGLIVEKNPGSEARREMGVQLQPFVMELIGRMKSWFDEIAGSNDITRGIRPEGVNAALAIQELQQAAQTRLRLKSRNIDCYLQDLGKHYLALITEFYSIPRIVRITNKNDPKLNDYFKFSVEKYHDENDGEEKTKAIIRPYIINQDGTVYEGDPEERHLVANLDVRVTTGSSLPFSKAEKESRLLNLFDRGIIDVEEVLKNLDYPNYEALLSRLEQKAAMAASVN